MKKKGILIISVLSIVFITVFGIYKYTHRVVPHQFKTDVERQEYIQKFSQVQGENKEKAITENAGGLTEVRLSNKGALMKYNNVDIMLSTDQKIADSIKLIPALYKDTNGIKDDELQRYFEKNKSTVITVLGIDTLIKLKDFIKTLEFLKNDTIKEAKIDENSMKKEGNIINFDLIITTQNNKTATYPIKVIATEQNGKINCLVYWR